MGKLWAAVSAAAEQLRTARYEDIILVACTRGGAEVSSTSCVEAVAPALTHAERAVQHQLQTEIDALLAAKARRARPGSLEYVFVGSEGISISSPYRNNRKIKIPCLYNSDFLGLQMNRSIGICSARGQAASRPIRAEAGPEHDVPRAHKVFGAGNAVFGAVECVQQEHAAGSRMSLRNFESICTYTRAFPTSETFCYLLES